MRMNCVVFTIIISINAINSEWVEIPQGSEGKEKGTNKPDFTFYVLKPTTTVTSTTTPRPLVPKPTAPKKSHTESHMKSLSIHIQNNQEGDVTSDKFSDNNSYNNLSETMRNKNKNEAVDVGSTVKASNNFAAIKNEAIDVADDLESEKVTTGNEKPSEPSLSYADFIPYLSKIQSSLTSSAQKNKGNKLNVLKNLQDHLLYEIQTRMSTLWSRKPKKVTREARDHKGDNSHMDFPSHEGALMTIGFLTFGVFLIKLVMQLIEKIHSNTTTTTFIGRKRRSTMESEGIQILKYIDEYQFN